MTHEPGEPVRGHIPGDGPSASSTHCPVLLPELLVQALRRVGAGPAVRLRTGERLSGHGLADEISRYAQALTAAGVTRQSGVATLSGNRPEVLFTTGAEIVLALRGTALHPLGSLDDHAHMIEDAGIDTLVYDPERFEERATALTERVPTLRRLLALGPSTVGDNLVVAAGRSTPLPLRPPIIDPSDVLRINYTGGTTGLPKGVVGTAAMRTAVAQFIASEWDWPYEPKHLICAPLSHAGGAVFVPVLLRGGSFVLLDRFDPKEVLATIESERVTTVMLVPTMIYALLDHPGLDTYDLSSLERIYYGASPISPTRLREAIERFGPVFFQFYGQAEAPMCVTTMRTEEHDVNNVSRLASCGRPVPWVRVELLNDGAPVVDGEPGEICVQGPLVMPGYHRGPKQTAEALEGGWLHTGDIAIRDADGFLRIIDRKRNMIVTGGYNVYPRDVEEVIVSHAAVSDVVVVGIPHEHWGEAVCAVVKRRPGAAVSEDELKQLVREQKGPVHAPKLVEFMDEIPLTPVGKPDRSLLRARYWEDRTRRVN